MFSTQGASLSWRSSQPLDETCTCKLSAGVVELSRYDQLTLTKQTGTSCNKLHMILTTVWIRRPTRLILLEPSLAYEGVHADPNRQSNLSLQGRASLALEEFALRTAQRLST